MRAEDTRRAEVLEALLRITRRDGLDAVSVRTVAAEAELSMGYVQRQFPTKDDLLKAAFEYSLRTVNARLDKQIAEVVPGCPGQVLLRRVAVDLITGAPEHVDEGRVWIAFLARAVVSAELAEVLRGHYAAGRDLFTAVLLLSQQYGELSPEVDAEHEADALLALIDGLDAHVLIGRIDLAAAQLAITNHLARLYR
ncbi:hypothetical protein GCM10010174_90740 [Kutzneria viridogrisea]|uniref:HTH tetR-type domain-containing protein n=2 Tax=Kutzneria TaxID=43356 RepID=W5VZZ9_9PSEU|nr:TetR family transcriptional regulator C-terminal domain-containing protein [Kutzneria albida]AHH93871.1 hypothetical protein KALB_495 [Kutzneria albida DSM 43870]MBA8931124.1 AcrR family transcriptional regulator [Kutzneria viridogrisea]